MPASTFAIEARVASTVRDPASGGLHVGAHASDKQRGRLTLGRGRMIQLPLFTLAHDRPCMSGRGCYLCGLTRLMTAPNTIASAVLGRWLSSSLPRLCHRHPSSLGVRCTSTSIQRSHHQYSGHSSSAQVSTTEYNRDRHRYLASNPLHAHHHPSALESHTPKRRLYGWSLQ